MKPISQASVGSIYANCRYFSCDGCAYKTRRSKCGICIGNTPVRVMRKLLRIDNEANEINRVSSIRED